MRDRLHRKQRLKALGTKVLTAARIKIKDFMSGVEKTRASEAPTSGLETMGDCDRLLRAQLVDSKQTARTKKNAGTSSRPWRSGGP